MSDCNKARMLVEKFIEGDEMEELMPSNDEAVEMLAYINAVALSNIIFGSNPKEMFGVATTTAYALGRRDGRRESAA